ncbi:MAG: ADP-glyceromanno-heptose 6-epimerase [Opitutales bacterium]|nr:ADP-glyceromanno-heptose 6-epimerase [Opitutales bacterium]
MKHDLSQGKILVTGGSGLIGSAIIARLNALGYENILVTDKLGTDFRYKNLVPLHFAEYMEYEDFDRALEKDPGQFSDIRTIFHLGACSSTTEKDCTYLVHNNYEYTKKMAAFALGQGARFVYASSAATYGDGSNGMDDEGPIAGLKPLNMYGYSKHLFDLHALRNGYADKICGVKYFNVFGPNENHKDSMVSMVFRAFNQIKETGGVKLFKSYKPEYKDGEQKRDFLGAKEAAAITVHLAQNLEANGLVNVGSGKARTWLDLVRPIFKAMGVPEKIEFVEMPEHIKRQYQYFTEAKISKLERLGGAQYLVPLEESVSDYVLNYLLPDKHLGE